MALTYHLCLVGCFPTRQRSARRDPRCEGEYGDLACGSIGI